MPRPLRIQTRGLTHHVFCRCLDKKPLLEESCFSDLFIEVIRKTQKRYRFDLTSFQIMDNHIHLVIHTVEDGESISRIMQYIKARFAECYNRILDRCGPFWNERFKDKIIEFSENPIFYLLWLLWYLAFNPVRRGSIKDPRNYRYTSINSYLDEAHAPLVRITLHDYFIQLGNSFDERVARFLLFEEAFMTKHSLLH
jgi:putative transposase